MSTMSSSTNKTSFQDNNGNKPLTGDEVVISGIAGLFPNSESVQEFKENLFNKMDMVTTENSRWNLVNIEMPKHLGIIKNINDFDASFFKVNYRQSCNLERMGAKILESTYCALYDAGISPVTIKGKNIAVFIGSASSELEKTTIYKNLLGGNGLGLTGICRSLYANRISYWLDIKGPSYSIDASCATALLCIEQAYNSIRNGECDSAIVGVTNYCSHPYVTLNYKRAGYLCLDGKTKSFDKNGDGFVRSDSINVLYIQKARDAKRIYAEICLAEGNYTLSLQDEFTPVRDVKFLTNFFNEVYSRDSTISPDQIEYVEGYAAGMGQADINELEAIGKVFGKKKTIKVGSVKSNMGHSEVASGGNSLIKLCIAYQKGMIPANLHYYNPPDHINDVREEKVQVLREHSVFNRGYTAVNCFSINGYDMHVVLKGHYQKKDPERYLSNIPYLITASGRQEMAVEKIINILKKQPIDFEQISLLHNIHSYNIQNHMCRGYTILEGKHDEVPKCLSDSIEYYPDNPRPVWFLYSGMGSQWAGMGSELMRIPIFAAAIEKCHHVLQPKGIDIKKILTDNDTTIYDNILNSFVGIAAVQIGLTDILTEMGIVPDNIIGHSVGELGCAYADGCFTAEEMILSAYSRGLVSVQTPFIKGSMAAVGLGYSAVLPICPPEIEVACHNSSESSTISGPADIMKEFVSNLTRRNVFAKEVPCSNIAYHSRYIADAGPGLLQLLSEVITDPKPRSKKWLSTSIPKEKWDDSIAKYSSAQYHTNNLLNQVLFEETARMIPSDAIIIEIAPHGLLQAIVKKSHSTCIHVPLTKRNHANPVKYFLEAIGKLYTVGLNPKVEVLYPKVQYPVSTETAMLSHLVGWEHSEEWPVQSYDLVLRTKTMERECTISIHDDDYKYLEGHKRNGQLVFPESALLVLVWETFAMSKGVNYRQMSVTFNDVQFHGEITIHKEIPISVIVMINNGNNMFEISFQKTIIVSGVIQETQADVKFDILSNTDDIDKTILNTKDIYNLLYLRDYSYEDKFQSIISVNTNLNNATIKFDNWITFLDGLIQLNALSRDHNGVSVPKFLLKLCICVEQTLSHQTDKSYGVYFDRLHKRTICDAIQIEGIVFVDHPKSMENPNCLQINTFVPHQLQHTIDEMTAFQIILQIVNDNINNEKIKVTEFMSNSSHNLSSMIKEVAQYIPSIEIDITTIPTKNKDVNDSIRTNCKLLCDSNLSIVQDVLERETTMKNIYDLMKRDNFLISLEKNKDIIEDKYSLFNVITCMSLDNHNVLLLKKKKTLVEQIVYIPIINDNLFAWVPELQKQLEKSQRVVLISENQQYCGLLGFARKIMKNYPKELSIIMIDDKSAPCFNVANKFYIQQLQKDLKINVLRNGEWGGYYNVSSEVSAELNNVALMSLQPGDIDSLTWVEKQLIESNINIVQVSYASITQKDVEIAVGDCTGKSNFGKDFSGYDVYGKRIMGIAFGGSITSLAEVDPDLVWPVPDHWSLEEAATIPVAYLLAYYYLAIQNTLQKKSSVFVTGGAGALGQAVISICLALECKVYTTVSDIHKKNFLLNLFPQLDEHAVSCSNDYSFYESVVLHSKNICCDVVINCAIGTLRESAMKCTGNCGNFIDISSFDMKHNKSFGMSYLWSAKNYISTQLNNLNSLDCKYKKTLHTMIAEGIASGIVRPLTHIVYSPGDVSKAFRLVSACRNRGRVLIKMSDPMVLNEKCSFKLKITCSPKASYVIVCDNNEMAVNLADWLIKNGAKNFVINIKTIPITGYLAVKLKSWRKLEATVKVSSESLEKDEGCTNLLSESSKLGAVHGIFVALDFENKKSDKMLKQTEFIEKFEKSSLIVMNLDTISRNICTDLSYFAVLTCQSENAVDSYNNSFVEQICQSRHDVGLPAVTYQISLLDQFEHNTDISSTKLVPQTVSNILDTLELILKLNKYHSVISYNFNKTTATNFLKKIATILGIKHIDDVDENSKISDLLVYSPNILEIQTVLKNMFKVSYTYEQIVNLSIAELKQLDKTLVKQNSNYNGDLGVFCTYIEQNECTASDIMIPMRTIVNLDTSEMFYSEINLHECLFLIPGFDGNYQVFNLLCKSLKEQAITLQLTPTLVGETIPEIANQIMQEIKLKITLKNKFYIMGYSFGVNVALEVAALLEEQGFTGVVFCLDGSPDAMRAQMKAYLGNLTDNQLQNVILEHMYWLMSGHTSEELSSELQTIKMWPEKILACINRLKNFTNHSHGYQRNIIQNVYHRIKAAQDYKPNFKLQSQIVLIKGIQHPNQQKLSDDFNLSQYTTQPVQIFNIESDHVHAPHDCRVTNILNNFIDPEQLLEFKKLNLCENKQ